MNIVIYDTHHFETTYALLRIWDIPGNRITLFVTPEVAAPLNDLLLNDVNRFYWKIKNANNLLYLEQLYRYCRNENIHLLLLSTVAYHHILFAMLCRFLPETTVVLTLHDINSFFKPKFSLSGRTFIRYMGKKMLARSVSAYSTLLSSTKRYIEEKFKPPQPVYVIPGSIYEGKNSFKTEDIETPKIVVPGSIDIRRKNYEAVFELLNFIHALQKKWELILLGAADPVFGRDVLQKFKTVKKDFPGLIFYESRFIEAKEYERQLEAADFIFIPLQQYTIIEDNIPEEYGVTKSTGSFFDAVRHAKPVIVPDYINVPEELKRQTFSYKTIDHLIQFLLSITKDTSALSALQQQTLENTLKFTPQAIRAALPQFFE
ncbi:MAG: hypothetical protein ICV84_11200 [Flavisolibacter sp.]|nr:hypothetical protein [Flavisolibacter sp.]